MSNEIDPEKLRELILYDSITGALTWQPRPIQMFKDARSFKTWSARFNGKPALNAQKGAGYKHGKIYGKLYQTARVAWALYHGEWPTHHIDHVNGDASDNAIANLRDVPRSENMRNRKMPNSNTSGHVGVVYHKGWVAQIGVNNKQVRIGQFKTKREAIAARKAAEVAYGYHCNHGRNNA
jgi:hypothetical protein